MPSLTFICPWCQLGIPFTPAQFLRQWQPQRTMATAIRRRRPASRMILSKDVSRVIPGGQNIAKKPPPGPFGGMNQIEARIRGRIGDRAKAKMLRRSSSRRAAATSEKALNQDEVEGSDERRGRGEQEKRSKKSKDEKPLFHALKMQTTLTPLSYSQRTLVKERLDKISSFDDFGLRPDVYNAIYTQALLGMTDIVPTPIQKLAIPALLSKKDQFRKDKALSDGPTFGQFLLAAETGSGKTLAYLLPVIDATKRQEEIDNAEEEEREAERKKELEESRSIFDIELDQGENAHYTTGRPRAIILLPSSELVTQVGRLVKLLGHAIKYRSAPLSSAVSATVIRSRLYNPNGIDIIVATPHLISSIAEKDPNILSRVQYLVIDEADSLLDRSFSPITCGIIDRAAPSLKQLILSSATIPRSLDSFLDKRFPHIARLVTPKLHSIPRRVQMGVVDVEKAPYRGNRSLACADIIWSIGRAVHDDSEAHHTVKSILVFVNEREKAEGVAKFLALKGIEAVALTRDTSEQRQSEILAAFTSNKRVDGDLKEPGSDRRRNFGDFVPFDQSVDSVSTTKGAKRLANTKVLVTTDLGSRGIDTLAVRTVILYDVPHTTIDFVHRLGRTGRMGRRGRGIVLVGKHDRKDVVREVREAMFRGQALI